MKIEGRMVITRSKAFTLVELLLVVAIIAILAAIALPNFLEAQTRSKVSRAMADLRSASIALEAYAADHNGLYPPDHPRTDLDGFLAAVQLSTPVAYLTSIRSMIDPFRRDFDLVPNDADETYRYWDLKSRQRAAPHIPSLNNGLTFDGNWILSSAGPDKLDDYPTTGDHRFEPIAYDPTNGTTSRGDIFRIQK